MFEAACDYSGLTAASGFGNTTERAFVSSRGISPTITPRHIVQSLEPYSAAILCAQTCVHFVGAAGVSKLRIMTTRSRYGSVGCALVVIVGGIGVGRKPGRLCLSNSSDDGQEGIRVQLRLLVGGPADQRFDVNGNEVLQVRGHVLDGKQAHPEVVVRFSGQRRAELYRWAGLNKHLAVDGFLQVKHWQDHGRPRVALLVEAINLSPLDDIDLDLSRAGIYATRGRTGALADKAPPVSKEARTKKARELLDLADA